MFKAFYNAWLVGILCFAIGISSSISGLAASTPDFRSISDISKRKAAFIKYFGNLAIEANDGVAKKDFIPPSLIISQAAIESAWGTSRFARKGNNYFGHWCYKKGCGIIPRERPEGSKHEVRKFKNAKDSLNAYINNLNTNRAYKKLRDIRVSLISKNKPITGKALAAGLSSYSAMGDKYIDLVRSVIRTNNLEEWDK